jgi:hypothetical protein
MKWWLFAIGVAVTLAAFPIISRFQPSEVDGLSVGDIQSATGSISLVNQAENLRFVASAADHAKLLASVQYGKVVLKPQKWEFVGSLDLLLTNQRSMHVDLFRTKTFDLVWRVGTTYYQEPHKTDFLIVLAECLMRGKALRE